MNTLHQNLSGERADHGSRDPIDIKAHWNWHNPLNILPLGIVAMVLLGIALMVLK
jgi:hypothetical protein